MLHCILQPDIISHSTSIPWLPWTTATLALRRIIDVALQPNVVTLGHPAVATAGVVWGLFEDCGEFMEKSVVMFSSHP